MKKRTHKGYTFYHSGKTTQTREPGPKGHYHERIRKLYLIEGLKEDDARPFLTSVQSCIDYINSVTAGEPRPKPKTAVLIRNKRLNRDMTQKELGEALGYTGDVAQVTVARWEAGTKPVPMDKIKDLAQLLKIDPLDLLP